MRWINRHRRWLAALPLLLAGGLAASARTGETASPGTAHGRDAFMQPAAGLAPGSRLDWQLGSSVFRKLWVPSPASTAASDGLGPLYNARSCMACHVRDGRGRPELEAGRGRAHFSLVLHLASDGEGTADPVYGRQLQTAAATGMRAEGEAHVAYEERSVTLAGGENVMLRSPRYRIEGWGYEAPGRLPLVSPRLAPPMIGLGLIEAVPEADLRALADPDDRNEDGISGRIDEVWSHSLQRRAPGRFGWKAEAATVADQSAMALVNDLGLSNPLIRLAAGDCTSRQPDCLAAPSGETARDGGLELGAPLFERLVLYARNLAVPPRRDADDPEVQQGEALFAAIGCAACHRPQWTTTTGQRIAPYTDLLLHDMGDGLADTGGAANAGEWRTPPLWGIGLTETVSGQTALLHDGRARSLKEAILWHEGEAQKARDAFARLQQPDRERLIAFLNSL